MDPKRALAVAIAFCLGLAIGVAALYSLRPPPRTVVEPIEVEQRDDGEPDTNRGNASPKGPRSGSDKKGNDRAVRGPSSRQRSEDGDENVPAPVPPAPAGDDDGADGSDNDDGDDDGGGDD